MSWFDATGLASIAKTALKEAQKTIDKALDIKDTDFTSTPTNTPIDTNDDFFGTWGLTQTTSGPKNVELRGNAAAVPNKSHLTTSLWGSFTGSFFEAPKENKSSSDALDDSKSESSQEYFSRSKLCVQGNSDDDASMFLTQGNTEEVLDSCQSK